MKKLHAMAAASLLAVSSCTPELETQLERTTRLYEERLPEMDSVMNSALRALANNNPIKGIDRARCEVTETLNHGEWEVQLRMDGVLSRESSLFTVLRNPGTTITFFFGETPGAKVFSATYREKNEKYTFETGYRFEGEHENKPAKGKSAYMYRGFLIYGDSYSDMYIGEKNNFSGDASEDCRYFIGSWAKSNVAARSSVTCIESAEKGGASTVTVNAHPYVKEGKLRPEEKRMADQAGIIIDKYRKAIEECTNNLEKSMK